jgi:molecular chaperone DnaK (HSP70)
MAIKKMLHNILISNFVLASLLFASLPTMAASNNVANSVQVKEIKTLSLLKVNTKYIKDADSLLKEALENFNGAANAKADAEAETHFASAIDNLKSAAKALQEGGMSDTAEKLENAIQSLEKALNSKSEKEQDEFIENAITALGEVDGEITEKLKHN